MDKLQPREPYACGAGGHNQKSARKANAIMCKEMAYPKVCYVPRRHEKRAIAAYDDRNIPEIFDKLPRAARKLIMAWERDVCESIEQQMLRNAI
jgi:hypothetical protein